MSANGWTFERLFASGIQASAADRITDIRFDGLYIWVVAGAKIYIYKFVGSTIDGSGHIVPDYELERTTDGYYLDYNVFECTLVTTVTLSFTGGYVRFWNGKAYVTNNIGTDVDSNITHTQIVSVDMTTYVVSSALITYSATSSSPLFANNKYWVVTPASVPTTSDPLSEGQSLVAYSITTWLSVSSTEITGRKQFIGISLVDNLSGQIWLTNFNTHSVDIFSTIDGSFINTFVINRHPYKIHVEQDKSIYVFSDSAMIQTVDPSTHAISSFASSQGYTRNAGIVSGSMWHNGGTNIQRLNTSTQEVKVGGIGSPNSTITIEDFLGVSSGMIIKVSVPTLNVPIAIEDTTGWSIDVSGLTVGVDYTKTSNTVTLISSASLSGSAPWNISVKYTGKSTSIAVPKINVATSVSVALIGWAISAQSGATTLLPGNDYTIDTSANTFTLLSTANLDPTQSTIVLSFSRIPARVMHLVPQASYYTWDGSTFSLHTTDPYLFWANAGTLYYANVANMLRTNYTQVRAGAMIAVGGDAYIGDRS